MGGKGNTFVKVQNNIKKTLNLNAYSVDYICYFFMHIFGVIVTRSSYLYSVLCSLPVASSQWQLHSWEKD